MKATHKNIRAALQATATKERAETTARFFKTGKGEYGEGDIFMGVTMPEIRKVIKDFADIDEAVALKFLASKIHEERQLGVLMLVELFKKGSEKTKKHIYEVYLSNSVHINNWDLVDISSDKVVGSWLLDKPTKKLEQLAKSKVMWERRIAMLATFAFIRAERFDIPLKIADMLLNDAHDLMHKAVGWMLREIGKRDKKTLTDFLKTRYEDMPRTMLRYAIEKFPEPERKRYLHGKV